MDQSGRWLDSGQRGLDIVWTVDGLVWIRPTRYTGWTGDNVVCIQTNLDTGWIVDTAVCPRTNLDTDWTAVDSTVWTLTGKRTSRGSGHHLESQWTEDCVRCVDAALARSGHICSLVS